MSTDDIHPTGRRGEHAAAAPAGQPSTEDLQRDIDEARAQLAENVDAISDKLDVKSQANAKVDAARQAVSHAASRAMNAAPVQVQQVVDRATGKAAPVVRDLSEKARPVVRDLNTRAAPHRGKIAAAAVGTTAVVLLARRRSRRHHGQA